LTGVILEAEGRAADIGD